MQDAQHGFIGTPPRIQGCRVSFHLASKFVPFYRGWLVLLHARGRLVNRTSFESYQALFLGAVPERAGLIGHALPPKPTPCPLVPSLSYRRSRMVVDAAHQIFVRARK